jgi:hypothetical protein
MTMENNLPLSFERMLFEMSGIARVVCTLFGALALVGFLYFGSLSVGMMAGFAALSAAIIPASRPGSTDHRSTSILTLATLGLVFQIADVIVYYSEHNIPGNYYAWPESVATFIALAVMALYGAATRKRQRNAV